MKHRNNSISNLVSKAWYAPCSVAENYTQLDAILSHQICYRHEQIWEKENFDFQTLTQKWN